MLKLQWDLESDPFKHCFVIGNRESIFMQWFYMTQKTNNFSGSNPINIKVFDLAGNEQNTEFWPGVHGEYTHG
jgi:hypothetical protein